MTFSWTASRALLGATAIATISLANSAAAQDERPPVPEGFEGEQIIESVIDSYAPVGFTGPDGQPAGLDPEIGYLLGPAMGVDMLVQPNAFENSMLGLASGRVQIVPGASITAARMETMDFVPYFRDAYRLAVLPDADPIGEEISDLCGVNAGFVTGDITIATINDYNENVCAAEGLEPIEISTFSDGAAIAIAVRSGRVDAWSCALTACSYQNSVNPGTWQITGPTFGHTTIGIASAKDSGWAPLIAYGLKKMMDEGTYQEILAKYEVSDGAIPYDEVVVNPTPEK